MRLKIKDEIWIQQNGVGIQIKDMTEEHAKNVLRLIIRRMRKESYDRALNNMFNSWVRDQLHDLPRMDRIP